MAHDVDGYDVTYVSRTSWKAELRSAGKLLDVVPVTWTDGWRQDSATRERSLPVYFKDGADLESHRTNAAPFVVAVAEAHDKPANPRVFKRFVGVFKVVATGERLSENSIEARLLRRLNGRRTG